MSTDDETKSNDSQGVSCIPNSSNNESDQWNPTKFLKELRDQALVASLVECDESMTLDLLIAQCHALVITNKEIWERCKPFYCTRIASADALSDECIFYRVGYWNVRAAAPLNCSMTFEATPELTKHSFEIPIRFPETLECLVVHPHPAKNDIMPDYELFLKRSLLLMDEVLPGFLVQFRAFLENQQITLGKVDAWLMQADENAPFLKNQFNVTISCDWQNLGGRFSSWETCEKELAESECLRCRSKFQHHIKRKPQGWVYCCSDKKPGCFPLQNTVVLLRQNGFPGTMNVKFWIEKPSERRQLIKCLEFVQNREVTMA